MVRPGFSFGIGMADDGHFRPAGHFHNHQQGQQPQPRESISSRSLRGSSSSHPKPSSSSTSFSSSSAPTSPAQLPVSGGTSVSGGPGASGGAFSGSATGSRTGVARGTGAVLGAAGGGMALRRGMAAFWATYNASLAERPLFTKCVTGIVGTVLGDLIAQLSSHALTSTPIEGGTAFAADPPRLGRLRHPAAAGAAGDDDDDDLYTAGKGKDKDRQRGGAGASFKYDVQRVLRLCLWSVVVGTPLAHYWFRLLDTRVMPGAPTSNAAVVTKLLLDQLVMSPAGTAFFFFGFRLLEGGTVRDARASVASKWGPTMALNYVLWPAANIINFKFVPPEQRILYVNCVALFWSAIMSHMANRKEPGAGVPLAVGAAGSGSGSGSRSGVVEVQEGGGRGLLSVRSRGLAAEPAGSEGPYVALARK